MKSHALNKQQKHWINKRHVYFARSLLQTKTVLHLFRLLKGKLKSHKKIVCIKHGIRKKVKKRKGTNTQYISKLLAQLTLLLYTVPKYNLKTLVQTEIYAMLPMTIWRPSPVEDVSMMHFWENWTNTV